MSSITVSPEAAAAMQSAIATLAAAVNTVFNGEPAAPVQAARPTPPPPPARRNGTMRVVLNVPVQNVPAEATPAQVAEQFASCLSTLSIDARNRFNQMGQRYGVTFGAYSLAECVFNAS